MTEALAIQLIAALLGDLPSIITDVEALVAAAKGTVAPKAAPIEPGIVYEDAALLQGLTSK